MKPNVKSFYDEPTATVTYLVWDEQSRDAVIIDSVLDYDPASSRYSLESVEKVAEEINKLGLRPILTLETHAHADHLSGAQELKKRFPELKTAIGRRITEVQSVFKKIYNLSEEFIPNGSQFDLLVDDAQTLQAGTLLIEVIATPGHTPACVSYKIGDALFTGDALFMPDTGTGRCDFPSGSSKALYESIHSRLYQLPDTTRVFVGHDYKAGGTREAKWETTIGEEKLNNIQLKANTSEADYTRMRDQRDATLSAPRLLLPSLQVNIDAGHLPKPENNGASYLKLPIRPARTS